MGSFTSSVTIIINIVLNTILIFGLLGFPVLGARGAAIATLISRIVELIWSVSLSHCNGYLHPALKSMFHRNPLLNKDFTSITLPVLFASLLWGIGFTSYTAIMGHLGQDAAAANSVAAVVRDLTCCMCNGIAGAAGVILGNELGQPHGHCQNLRHKAHEDQLPRWLCNNGHHSGRHSGCTLLL